LNWRDDAPELDSRVQERRFNVQLEKMEERSARRFDELTKTLDRFLKRLSDIEEEFTFMKADLNRVKAILREKLGVVLDYIVIAAPVLNDAAINAVFCLRAACHFQRIRGSDFQWSGRSCPKQTDVVYFFL
jgi:hypothetical protein